MKRYLLIILLIIFLFSYVFLFSLSARDSPFTKKGSGPRYWTTYEYQYVNNDSMPESLWDENVAWIADKFKDSGYKIVCTDGWIEGAGVSDSSNNNITPNGYIKKHNDSWTKTWSDIKTQVEALGLELGIYYNPLWITQYVKDHPNDFKIEGTNTPVADLTQNDDRFDGEQGAGNHPDLYWVNVSHADAEKFVKGYVQFFKSQKTKYLRIDFLTSFEDNQA